MKLDYRNATVDDARLLIDIYNKSFYEDFVRYGECPAYGKTEEEMQKSIQEFPKEIIMCDGTPVGAISSNNRGNGDYYIGCLCVIPEFQNKGIGSSALEHYKDTHQDYTKLSLITPNDKKQNIGFYTNKCGFEITGIELDGNVEVARLVLLRK